MSGNGGGGGGALATLPSQERFMRTRTQESLKTQWQSALGRPASRPLPHSDEVTQTALRKAGLWKEPRASLRSQERRLMRAEQQAEQDAHEEALETLKDDIATFEEKQGQREARRDVAPRVPYQQRRELERREMARLGVKEHKPVRPPSATRFYDYQRSSVVQLDVQSSEAAGGTRALHGTRRTQSLSPSATLRAARPATDPRSFLVQSDDVDDSVSSMDVTLARDVNIVTRRSSRVQRAVLGASATGMTTRPQTEASRMRQRSVTPATMLEPVFVNTMARAASPPHARGFFHPMRRLGVFDPHADDHEERAHKDIVERIATVEQHERREAEEMLKQHVKARRQEQLRSLDYKRSSKFEQSVLRGEYFAVRKMLDLQRRKQEAERGPPPDPEATADRHETLSELDAFDIRLYKLEQARKLASGASPA